MSKLVLFLFLGVCVMAVHMEAVNDEGSDNISDAELEALVNSVESKLKEELLAEDPRINFKKIWNKAKPILKEIGKVAKPIVTEAAKAAAAAAAGGYVKGGK
ncbi:uncharacterized protein [Halyomorpha halys]|uniref:uncharacterized protein n=1 Tax=Halyomorpha halys TaxID=286706 RepID=UPI0006D517AD|nr:uncharacterized protein LOC106690193 [Halyomorpha halys]